MKCFSHCLSWSGQWGLLGLMATFVLLGWGTALAQQEAPVAPPPPALVPPNGSRITATVLKSSVWPRGSLRHSMPPVPGDQRLYSVRLKIHIAEPEESELNNLAQPGKVVGAFSAEALASNLVGKQIRAVLKLSGDTRGVRWWISNVHILP